ncbi:hypothetical protein GPECTOR_6g626 [Gonium pectorale]|uniref:tRNA ligase phosphodiesterase domain-containing protein n=1 Tax=Gonium pectorale TaxID=33097 RepID=A0A150GV45_GONPE|nr:hypothetical protein GPECTOR_6g626 [Gonium pectorale]|eukprot:KXZ53709.1 hypothetical protein GPECTOR_6g626 [Gonium pectorale]
MDPATSAASLVMVQNMVLLCKQLNIRVSYKVLERAAPRDAGAGAEPMAVDGGGSCAKRLFSVVVHVHGDHSFKKYLKECSSSDLLLYRGLLLQVEASPDLSSVLSARVQQAFLPKFENEGQDATVADAVAAAASSGRPTVVTVKHSGSLVTLSAEGGWAAKNSVGNEYTAGGAALLRAHYERRAGGDPGAAQAALDRLFRVMAERRLALSFEMVRSMRALAGPAESSAALRYKKKMVMWSFPDAAPGSSPAPAPGTAGGGVVGYSLMTFVIRNGLAALKQGGATYAAYVDNLVRRSWRLPAAQVAQVQHFARCWAAWVGARGGAAAVSPDSYLDLAEPFAAEFLARRGAMALSGRGEDAFQGILLCVDTPEHLTAALRRAVAPSLELSVGAGGPKGGGGELFFSKGMVPGGAMLWLQPGGDLPKQLRAFLSSGAAPFTWVVAAAPPRPAAAGEDGNPAAKRQKGIAAAKLSALTSALGAEGAAQRLRHVMAPAAADDPDGAATARLAAELAGWLGRGTPLPAADPSVAVYFVTIPGAGKSVLTQGLSLPAAGEGQEEKKLTVKVLNSDTMKKTVKGFNPNRYWQEIASAADSCVGGGHVTVAVADKNLVPAPPGNIPRALEPLKGTGVASLALVPTVLGSSTASSALPGHADLYLGLPGLPFPLELLALCMMRTLKRRNHEGGLDGASAPSAATVVAMFAGFYRNKPLGELVEALRGQFTRVAELPIMRGDGGGDGGAADGTDGAAVVSSAAAAAAGGGGRLPIEVLRHVAVGLRDVNERSKPQLPAEWEERARELLLRPDVVAALEALQLPLDDVRHRVEVEIAATLETVKAAAAAAASGGDGTAGEAAAAAAPAGLQPFPSISSAVSGLQVADGSGAAVADGTDSAAAAGVSEESVAYFSLTGLDEEALRAAAREVLPAELHGRLRKGGLHVTLWHRNDQTLGSRADLRRALLERVGSGVEVEVQALTVSPQVVAAEVTLLTDDEALTSKPYHHITLLVEKGHTAAESNQLPARLAAGEAGVERRALPGGPLLLRGVVAAVEGEEAAGKRQSLI